MKTFITFMALLIAVGANAQKTLKTDSVYLTGKVSNVDASKPNANTMVLVIDDMPSHSQPNYAATINNDGTYKLNFIKTGSQEVMLKYDNQLIVMLVTPGDHMHLDFDAKNFKGSLTFSGDGAKANQDYLAFNDAFYADAALGYNGDRSKRYMPMLKFEKEYEPEPYKKFLKDRYDKESVFTNHYLETHSLSPVFVNWCKADLKYEYINELFRYRWMHPNLNNTKIDDYKMPDSYYDFIGEINFNDLNAFISSNYGSIANEYLQYFTTKNLGRSYQVTDAFALIKKQQPGIIRDLMLSLTMNQLLSGGATVWVKKLMPGFKKNTGEKAYVDNVEKSLNRIDNAVLPTNAKINSLPKTEGDSLFAKMTSKYAGKIIYVDFWATWCIPCRAEMPYSKNLHDKLAGKDVVFLYVCALSQEKLWKSTIAELGIQGEHFFLNEKDYAAMSQKFHISGVPHYLLIDKNGRMVSDNAKRPSDEQLKPEIEKLLAAK
jgi:thiol-disulfide isomerase/thioredoxin